MKKRSKSQNYEEKVKTMRLRNHNYEIKSHKYKGNVNTFEIKKS